MSDYKASSDQLYLDQLPKCQIVESFGVKKVDESLVEALKASILNQLNNSDDNNERFIKGIANLCKYQICFSVSIFQTIPNLLPITERAISLIEIPSPTHRYILIQYLYYLVHFEPTLINLLFEKGVVQKVTKYFPQCDAINLVYTMLKSSDVVNALLSQNYHTSLFSLFTQLSPELSVQRKMLLILLAQFPPDAPGLQQFFVETLGKELCNTISTILSTLIDIYLSRFFNPITVQYLTNDVHFIQFFFSDWYAKPCPGYIGSMEYVVTLLMKIFEVDENLYHGIPDINFVQTIIGTIGKNDKVGEYLIPLINYIISVRDFKKYFLLISDSNFLENFSLLPMTTQTKIMLSLLHGAPFISDINIQQAMVANDFLSLSFPFLQIIDDAGEICDFFVAFNIFIDAYEANVQSPFAQYIKQSFQTEEVVESIENGIEKLEEESALGARIIAFCQSE